MMEMSGKVAIVTGAGRGIGRAIAAALGGSGCQMAVAGRSTDQLVAVADEIQKQGQQAIAVATDVTDESAVTVLAERTKAVFGRIDVLVNAVSMRQRDGFVEAPDSAWRDLIDTNLSGPYLCMRAVVPVMQQQGAGKIINVADRVALHPDGSGSIYGAAKSGLVGLTRSLAIELAAANIQVNAICPMSDGGDPAAVAAAAVFLAGPGGDAITGQAIEVGR
jgi:NAD(P)-dependent dehydrogenase (short-subunit alcohol dehydrogenase family)